MYFIGSAGSDLKAKMCDQITTAIIPMVGMLEALILADKYGLSESIVTSILEDGINTSPLVKNQSKKITERNCSPELSVNNF